MFVIRCVWFVDGGCDGLLLDGVVCGCRLLLVSFVVAGCSLLFAVVVRCLSLVDGVCFFVVYRCLLYDVCCLLFVSLLVVC